MTKRELNIENFDQVRDEVRRLLSEGYRSLGRWNLGQVCFHLDCWMRYPMDGFPPIPIYLRPVFWTMKKLVGRKMFLKILSDGEMKDGAPTMGNTVGTSNRSADRAEAEKFLETLERFTQFSGEVHPSPVFGPMTLDECRQLQLIHCRHHLGYLDVKQESA